MIQGHHALAKVIIGSITPSCRDPDYSVVRADIIENKIATSRTVGSPPSNAYPLAVCFTDIGHNGVAPCIPLNFLVPDVNTRASVA
jgi:hypothetical protein